MLLNDHLNQIRGKIVSGFLLKKHAYLTLWKQSMMKRVSSFANIMDGWNGGLEDGCRQVPGTTCYQQGGHIRPDPILEVL